MGDIYMQHYSKQIIYQIGFLCCCAICVLSSFLTFFKASYDSDGETIRKTYHLAGYGFAWELLVIVAAGVGVYFTFISFNKLAVLLSGVSMGLVAVVAYTKSENIATELRYTKSTVNEVDALMQSIDSTVKEVSVNSSFTAAFYIFAIAAVGAIIFAICETLFINEK